MVELVSASFLSLVLVFLAEIGDKSQLVCMALAAKHRGWPVFLGSLTAFALLNGVAVMFGGSLAHWIPQDGLAVGVAVLFAVFGIKALLDADEETPCKLAASAKSLFLTSFSMIFLAEFGDKTQLAVAGLATQHNIIAVWVGSTLALAATSGLGVFAGRKLLSRTPLHWLHRAGGILFLVMAGLSVSSLWWV